MSNKQPKSIDFEQSLDEIAGLVGKMEQGKLPLEEALQSFEKGVKLVRNCQQALNDAKQNVKILTENNKLEPFENNDDDASC